MMNPSEVSGLLTQIKPFILSWLQSSTGLSGPAAPSPHALDSSYHSGTLALTQLPSLNVSAGIGLSGGGSITPSGSTSITVDLNYAFAWTALHTFGAGIRLGADVDLSRTGANVLGLGVGDYFRSGSFVAGTTGWSINQDGSAEFENVRVRGELVSTVFKYQEVQATAGTLGVFLNASTVNANFTTPGAISGTVTAQLKNTDGGTSLFNTNSRLRVRTFNGSLINAWFTIDSVGANSGTYTTYTLRLQSGSTNAVVPAGTAIVDYGPDGTGFITLSTDTAFGASANITIGTHAGAPWSATTTAVRLGNLNGVGSIITDVYGLYAATATDRLAIYGTTFEMVGAGGAFNVNSNGVSITPTTSYVGYRSYGFVSGATRYSDIAAWDFAGVNEMDITVYPISSDISSLQIKANGPASVGGTITLSASAVGLGSASVLIENNPSTSGKRVNVTASNINLAGNVNVSAGLISSAVSNGAVVRNSAAFSVVNATLVTLPFDTVDYDANSYANLGTYNTRLTVSTTGLYVISGHVSFASNATGRRGIYIRVNGVSYVAAHSEAAVNGDRTVLSICRVNPLAAGDYVQLVGYQDSGGNLNAEGIAYYTTVLGIARVA